LRDDKVDNRAVWALQYGFELRLLSLPDGIDPDKFIREHGVDAYREQISAATPYLDHVIERARQLGVGTAEQKLQAVNFILPYVQRLPTAVLRSEWASRIAQQLRVDEPVLRESLRRAAAERRSEVKTQPGLGGRAAKPAERRLVQMLMEPSDFRERLGEEIRQQQLQMGLETERILGVLLEACASGALPDATSVGAKLQDYDRRLYFEIVFESGAEANWEEAESCLEVLRRRKSEEELALVQRQIEACAGSASGGDAEQLRALQERKLELRRRLQSAAR
jgi:DNA primase